MASRRRKGSSSYLIPTERLDSAILEIRGHKVMLDANLASVYGVTTRALIQAVKRNLDRFPGDFVFQLTKDEFAALRSQSVTSKGRGGRRYPPYAFTEHGAVMLASILRSKRAVEVSVFVVKAFIRMRRILSGHRQLVLKLAELESKLAVHDKNFRMVFAAIRKLMSESEQRKPKPTKPIGFRPEEKKRK